MASTTEQEADPAATPFLNAFLADYPQGLAGYDEMWDAEKKQVDPHWQHLMQGIGALGDKELERRRTDARRLLRENGVTYHIYSDPVGQKRTWQLDPVPLVISGDDWTAISNGLRQRARLLDLILRDIYGPRRLIREGLIPPEILYSQRQFLRPCDGILHKDMPQLMLYAADLARGPDGRMWVLGDRTQAPSGSGYALESRMVMTRLMAEEFRQSQVHRLSIFFRRVRSMLAQLMVDRKDDPRVVILTPGPHNETYFEHAYLASYLGYSLVQGDDLTVRGGKVFMKALDGLKQVDIIVRRVDDTYCDPLELREDSHLGVPGLLQAARLGNVVIANPLGSSILESPALLPFLPNIARQWLGEEILLPSAATWWCGQKKERDYVLANLNKLVIKPIDRSSPSIFGSSLTTQQLEALKDRIKARPFDFVGQQILTCSTAPSLRAGKIVPRRVLLRSFLTAHEGDYDVMPGGLTRVAQDEDSLFVSNQAGGLSKDTWIIASEPVHQSSLWPTTTTQVETLLRSGGVLASRSGENLFWLGRYAERAEGLLRLARTALTKLADVDDYRDESDRIVLDRLLLTMTQISYANPVAAADKARDSKGVSPRRQIMEMVLNQEQRSSLMGTLQSMVQTAYSVRDLWSVDTWRIIDDIEEILQKVSSKRSPFAIMRSDLDSLMDALMAFHAQTAESMPHEDGWVLMNTGRRLERGLQLSKFLQTNFVEPVDEVVEHLLLEATLFNHESMIAHRRRYRYVQHMFTVFDLMVLDIRHPRSLAYQIDRLQDLLKELPQPDKALAHQLSREQRLMLQTETDVRLAEVEKLAVINKETNTRKNLARLLGHVDQRLEKVSELLHRKYFTHTIGARQLAPTNLETNTDEVVP
ncbi:circularly permuted type 2 ATP-grasp protein [Litorivivens sp.]|uniref:circularly permuted type 2 ATP-grasp protein n=1 Tax=Litorivivens sp. TaxID=2020868 RepID=UPI0035648739